MEQNSQMKDSSNLNPHFVAVPYEFIQKLGVDLRILGINSSQNSDGISDNSLNSNDNTNNPIENSSKPKQERDEELFQPFYSDEEQQLHPKAHYHRHETEKGNILRRYVSGGKFVKDKNSIGDGKAYFKCFLSKKNKCPAKLQATFKKKEDKGIITYKMTKEHSSECGELDEEIIFTSKQLRDEYLTLLLANNGSSELALTAMTQDSQKIYP